MDEAGLSENAANRREHAVDIISQAAGISESSSSIVDPLKSVSNDVGISKGITNGTEITEDIPANVITGVRGVVGVTLVTDGVTSLTRLLVVMASEAGPMGCSDAVARATVVLEGVTNKVRGMDNIGGKILMFLYNLRVSLGVQGIL